MVDGKASGILLETQWQHNSPIEEIHFNEDFTRVELKTGVIEWNLESRITLEGGLDHVDVTYENTNTGDTSWASSIVRIPRSPTYRMNAGSFHIASIRSASPSVSQRNRNRSVSIVAASLIGDGPTAGHRRNRQARFQVSIQHPR